MKWTHEARVDFYKKILALDIPPFSPKAWDVQKGRLRDMSHADFKSTVLALVADEMKSEKYHMFHKGRAPGSTSETVIEALDIQFRFAVHSGTISPDPARQQNRLRNRLAAREAGFFTTADLAYLEAQDG